MTRAKKITPRTYLSLFAAIAILITANAVFASQGIIPNLPPSPTFSVSTIPSNGDLNPYGVAFVPTDFPEGGSLNAGDILVSNFNASSNLQGTGTTIVRIDPNGQQSLFFQGQQGLGLSTALGVLRGGFVLVGNVPTTTPSGTCTQGSSGEENGVGQGSLLVIDRRGHLVNTLSSAQFLDGPWDLTVHDRGATAQVFVSNVLSGTVTRINLSIDRNNSDGDENEQIGERRLRVMSMTQIASGYTHRCDPAALVVGPTGLALNSHTDVLYVASTGDNAIYAVPNASRTAGDHGTGGVLIQDSVHLHGPLGLVRASNGDLITAQGDAVNPDPNQPNEIVEYTSNGHFVAQFSIDSIPGSAFGIALSSSDGGFRFAAVDDGLNVLDIWVVDNEDRAPE
jgi:hypothetical protein